MIQQIAISHGGQIKVTSDGEGKGATFELILPNAHRLKEKMLKNQKIEHGA